MHGAQDEGPSGQDGKTHPGPDGTEHEDGGDGGAVPASTKKKGKTPDGKKGTTHPVPDGTEQEDGGDGRAAPASKKKKGSPHVIILWSSINSLTHQTPLVQSPIYWVVPKLPGTAQRALRFVCFVLL